MKASTVTLAGSTVEVKDNSESVFSYSLTGGVTYNLNESSALFAEATFIKGNEYDTTEDGITSNIDSTSQTLISGGLRYRF